MGKLIEFNTSCASVFVQRAGVAAMQRAGDIVPQVVMQMQACRDRLFVELGSIPGLIWLSRMAGCTHFSVSLA